MRRLPNQIGVMFLPALAVFALLVGACLVCWYSQRMHRSREELLSLYNHIQPGMTAGDVIFAVANGHFQSLRIKKVSDTSLLVQTPIELGAGNWVMWLELCSNKVTGVRIRYHDSQHVKPKRSPPDKRFAAIEGS